MKETTRNGKKGQIEKKIERCSWYFWLIWLLFRVLHKYLSRPFCRILSLWATSKPKAIPKISHCDMTMASSANRWVVDKFTANYSLLSFAFNLRVNVNLFSIRMKLFCIFKCYRKSSFELHMKFLSCWRCVGFSVSFMSCLWIPLDAAEHLSHQRRQNNDKISIESRRK